MSFMLIAAILAALGFAALATVALAAGLSILSLPRIKSFALTLLWIVPALLFVGFMGYAPSGHHYGGAFAQKRPLKPRELPPPRRPAEQQDASPVIKVEKLDTVLTAEAPPDAAELAVVL